MQAATNDMRRASIAIACSISFGARQAKRRTSYCPWFNLFASAYLSVIAHLPREARYALSAALTGRDYLPERWWAAMCDTWCQKTWRWSIVMPMVGSLFGWWRRA